jgi:ABC-2 type transport system ATP-binding protein
MYVVRTSELRRVFVTGAGWRRRGTELVALDGVSLAIEAGEVHGLLGPNGAGKTTLVKILSTVLLPTSGRAEVCGRDVTTDTREVRRKIGIVFGGDRGLYLRLTARQNLEYWSALYRLTGPEGRRRAAALLERVGLAERADSRVETLSRGMRQRLHLARGLIGDPQVLFLDEPTVGLDPVAALEFRRLVRELQQEGRTILLTTHDMEEAESLCERVALIDRGRLLGIETPRALSGWIAAYERVDVAAAPPDVLDRVAALPGVGRVERRPDGGARIETVAEGAVSEVLRLLVGAGITALGVTRPSLEEVYLHLMGGHGMTV